MSSYAFRVLTIAVFAAAVGLSADGRAEDEVPEIPIDAVRVVDLTIASHPTLRASILDLRSAEQDVAFEQGRYPYTLQFEGGATRSSSASARDGESSVSTQDSVNVATQISRTFPTGTRAAVRMDGTQELRRTPVEIGPTYGSSVRASLTQPLMRGYGTTLGEQGLRIARINLAGAELSRNRVASELTRDVLNGYWELWYAHAAVRIERSARRLAKRELSETQQKIAEGVLPSVDALSFETRLASLEESVLSAIATRRQRALSLSVQIGAPEVFSSDLVTSAESPPEAPATPTRALALQVALQTSPEVRELESQLRSAQERLASAGDAYRPRLDLEGYVQLAGAGDQTVSPVLQQLGRASATSVHVGLIYELPLDQARKTAERAQVLLAVRSAEEKLRAARQRTQVDIDSMLVVEQMAHDRLALASQTAKRAETQLDAERERLKAGTGLPINVRQAQDDLRQAQLREIRAKVDLWEAVLDRKHLMGELLQQITARVDQADRLTK
jgi:outer membrane protein TolC